MGRVGPMGRIGRMICGHHEVVHRALRLTSASRAPRSRRPSFKGLKARFAVPRSSPHSRAPGPVRGSPLAAKTPPSPSASSRPDGPPSGCHVPDAPASHGRRRGAPAGRQAGRRQCVPTGDRGDEELPCRSAAAQPERAGEEPSPLRGLGLLAHGLSRIGLTPAARGTPVCKAVECGGSQRGCPR